MRRMHDMPFGAAPRGDGTFRFRMWAPAERAVTLEVGEAEAPMRRDDGGWHECTVPARAGQRYRYRLGDGVSVPDPASRFNPDDVHGASQLVDPRAYAWQHAGWRGRPWHEAVVYELHVGTFTPEGTFTAARKRLPDLVALGVTAVELMPVADFPGTRGWGYDGVLHFAPDASYGAPEDLKALVDAAHGHGLMMLLDVVYNHFGPDGNYLHAYCPQFFNPQKQTPWGAAIHFDGPGSRTVRDFYVHNALYWVEEYGFDGLRLDAVHAIRDESDPHIVCEIARALHDGPGRERRVHLVLENGANEAHLLERGADLVPRHATAQWNDDIHHAIHVLVTGEKDGYYVDFADAPLAQLGRALAEGFIFQGQVSPFHDHQPRGEPSGQLPSTAFVSFLQTHDQVGNRAYGERLHALARDERLLRAAYACVLLSPHVPMLFMGEEYAASTPFQYFCDFHDQLADAVRDGRRNEFRGFAAFRDEAARARIPDPNAVQTFERSKLRWDERQRPPHRAWLELVTGLLHLRRQHLVPHLVDQRAGGRHQVEGNLLHVEWALAAGARWRMLANFGGTATAAAAGGGTVVYTDGAREDGTGQLRLKPGAVRVTLEAARG
ncbi:MAG: malto-oligosyltrehalose trehalohydrolase [Betaproteobacteria bacterium]|nr:malto-oligosyltrehalose trehalohydrolase [Betaproteobacteria bacterium]MDH5350835.1 malto-oligosyltrehalose trehalohydrolase [Betaproteobacteria bacterium]